MGTKKTMTLKELMDKFGGFMPYATPKDEEGEKLEVNIIPLQKSLRMKGAEFLIDKESDYIFLQYRGKHFAYLGLLYGSDGNLESYVVTKENVSMGVPEKRLAKELKLPESALKYHLGVLEEAGLIEKNATLEPTLVKLCGSLYQK